ncbi:phosphopantetheine adenylyltransferase [Lactococcus hodotermopsidis]|uniref:Phosphopantetheine adenylyltransferase n=1 Tax=Pseudolactococcus hodotermopsidis TaxID=2709157 RepID=A0A6A0BD64_9LACT|nr:pantetheine-phosphate adenylyltransferase [Lactococcus hodotermopsidis]GFH43369.1 phosphopantetheine adenylyltransferase [Lactococcus hodotermopsidis]
MRDKIGLYTGTFDPMTNGHLDIIKRAAKLFDTLYVGIFQNNQKEPVFSAIERKVLFEKLLLACSNVVVIVHEADLTVNVAEKLGVTALVRSVRNAQDLAYESEMIYFNGQMTGIETVLLVASPNLQYLNSTRIKELARFGVDVSPWVPELVKIELEKKFE